MAKHINKHFPAYVMARAAQIMQMKTPKNAAKEPENEERAHT